MSLAVGGRLGSYEIRSLLGAGGMGEVFRARDAKLGRDVALKALPALFALDSDRLARFKREAQVLASLNHPNIAAIYGFEDWGGAQALVLELVDGPTLADRIAQGPIAIEEALPIAKQICDALEAAHEQGIIHRDLKPANIKVRTDGTVKVLDFGLAKALEPAAAASGDAIAAPTITSPALTRMGVILGTASYMSPEQARGHAADKRSDIWAFGCVIFEMLSGRRPFEGQEVSDTLASILKSDPPWDVLPSDLPVSVRGLIEGCLMRDRRERVADISTARFILSHPLGLSHPFSAPPTAPVRRPSPRHWWRSALLFLTGAAIAAAALIAVARLRPSPTVPITRFVIALPPGQQLTLPRQAIAMSPDGSRIAYAADGRIYLRSMSELEATAIAGTDGAVNPVFSPDGQSLLFWADSTLKRIAIGGGMPVTICTVGVAPSSLTWDRAGVMFYQAGRGIVRVSAEGGTPAVLAAMDNSEGRAHGPQMLPDGRSLLFTLTPEAASDDERWDNARIIVQSLASGERKTLIEGGSDGRYVPTGHLVYTVRGSLLAVPFNPATLTVTPGAVPIILGVRRTTSAQTGAANFAFSETGSLVYLPGPTSARQQGLALFDRQGGVRALKVPPGTYRYPRVSPNGKRVAFDSSDGKEAYVAIYDLDGTNSPPRLTYGGNNRFPIWSRTGTHVAFQSDRDGDPAIFWQPVNSGVAERLTTPRKGTSHVPEAWSPIEDVILFSEREGTTISLRILSIADRKTSAFGDVQSIGLPTDAAFSADGHWVAYQAGDSNAGEATTFVQPFPPNGMKHQIAKGGRPTWSADGRELFFVPAPGQFMAVTVTTRPSFAFTPPVPVHRGFGIADPASPRTFDMMPNGRIVGVANADQDPTGSGGPGQLRVVLNWFEELKTRVPTK